jgi:virginiamycin B lyase
MTEIGSGGGTVRHMTFDRASGQIWFGTDNGTIGRATVGTRARPIGE